MRNCQRFGRPTCADSSSGQTAPSGPSAQPAAAAGSTSSVWTALCRAGGWGGSSPGAAQQRGPLATERRRTPPPHFWLLLPGEREKKKINISCLNTPRGQLNCFSFLTGAAPSEFSSCVEESTSPLWSSRLFSSITSGTCNLSLVSEILLVQKQTIEGNLAASEA